MKKLLVIQVLAVSFVLAACSGGKTTATGSLETNMYDSSAQAAAASVPPSESSIESALTESSAAVASEQIQTVTQTQKDTEAPLFLSCPDQITVNTGDEFNVYDNVSYIDNMDSDVNLTVDGNVDTSSAGTYDISAIITDDAGNSRSHDITVSVAAQSDAADPGEQTQATETPRINYDDFISRYSEDGVLVGIDVSKWQGEIDFNAVKAAGCDFVMIRALKYTEGELGVDDYFSQNLANAKAAGLKVGVYYNTNAADTQTVAEHAEALIELLDGQTLDFPVAFDWESWACCQQYKLSMSDLNELYSTFRDRMQQAGYESMLYASKYYLETVWQPDSDTAVWLANYTDQTAYEGDYVMWQVNCIGRIDGIDGPVDIDLYYGEH